MQIITHQSRNMSPLKKQYWSSNTSIFVSNVILHFKSEYKLRRDDHVDNIIIL